MARAHGKNSRVFVSPNGTGVAVVISNLSQWSLDRATDAVEVTSFGDANKVYVQGLADLKGALSGFWDSASDPLYVAGISTDGCNMYTYPDFINTPTVYDYGPAWLNTSISVSISGAVTISGSFMARGSWGHKP